MYISAIVPVYNEEKTLYNNILNYDKYLKEQDYNYEIIIVNDGSEDGSINVIKRLSAENDSIKFIDNKKNRGKGFVIRQGLVSGKGEFGLFIDADNATSIDHLDLVWEKFKDGADIVIATRSKRDMPDTEQVLKQAKWKRTLGIFGNLLIQSLLVPGVWDTQCGFKVFRKEVIEKVVAKTKINRWAIDVEILSLSQKRGFRIKKIPVAWNNSEFSRVGIKGYLVALKEILKIKWNIFLKRYS